MIYTENGLIDNRAGSTETDVESIIRVMSILKSHDIKMNVYTNIDGSQPYIKFWYKDKLIANSKEVCFVMNFEKENSGEDRDRE